MINNGGNPTYYVEDLLGTSRVVTSNSGVVCYDADFYPFGGERSYTNSCPQNYKFEGKERDAETGNDDFGARYYSNRFGRWLSADWSSVPTPVPYANLTNPQTLNLYAMVSDDPESFADLDGHLQAQTYQVANPAASAAWDPGSAVSMSDENGMTETEFNLMQAAATAEQAAGQQARQQATDTLATVAADRAQWEKDHAETKRVGSGILQRIRDSLFIEGGVGVGVGVKVEVEGGSINAEASIKAQSEVTLSGKMDVSVVKEAKVTVEAAGVEIGAGKSKETVTVKDGKALPVHEEQPTQTVWGWKFPGAKTTSAAGGNKITVFQVSVCLLVCVEVGVGMQK